MNCYACNSTNIKSFNLCTSTVAGYRCDTMSEAINAPIFNLILDYCIDCSMLSQRRYSNANPLLNKLYEEHVSTQHATVNPYFERFAKDLIEKYQIKSGSKVLEIGCNCGLLLKTIRDYSGANVFGIEPSKAMLSVWHERNLNVVNGYLDTETEPSLIKSGPFDLIYFRHVFEHVPNPMEFIDIASRLLKDDGVIVLEVPYLKSITDDNRVENVSYSHLHQYCIRSLSAIFDKVGMGLYHHSLETTDGGSIVAHFKKGVKTSRESIELEIEKSLVKFIEYNNSLKIKVDKVLEPYNSEEIVGYGAGAKGQHLIHLLGLRGHIKKVIDDTPGFKGKFIPGTEIEIVEYDILYSGSVKAVINLAPTHLNVIKSKIPSAIDFFDFVNCKI